MAGLILNQAPRLLWVPPLTEDGGAWGKLPGLIGPMLREALALYADVHWRGLDKSAYVDGVSIERLTHLTQQGRCEWGLWLSEEARGDQAGFRLWIFDAARGRLALNAMAPSLPPTDQQAAALRLTEWLMQCVALIVFADTQHHWRSENNLASLFPTRREHLETLMLEVVTEADTIDHAEIKYRVQRCKQLLDEGDNSELTLSLLAQCYRKVGHYRETIRWMGKALQQARGAPWRQSRYAMEGGICCALLGEPDHALAWWKRAIELMPAQLSPYFNIALTMEEQNQEPDTLLEAAAWLERVRQYAGNDARIFANLARLYSKANAWQQALDQYHRLLALNGDDAWVYSDMGTCYLQLGLNEEARASLNKSLALASDGELAEFNRLVLAQLEA